MKAHMLPKMKFNGSVKEVEWMIVKPNENGHIKCLDCKLTFLSMYSAKEHHKHIHMMENRIMCEICNRGFTHEEYLNRHMQAHLLPKLKVYGSVKEIEWKIVQQNENGRINCYDCKQTFSTILKH